MSDRERRLHEPETRSSRQPATQRTNFDEQPSVYAPLDQKRQGSGRQCTTVVVVMGRFVHVILVSSANTLLLSTVLDSSSPTSNKATFAAAVAAAIAGATQSPTGILQRFFGYCGIVLKKAFEDSSWASALLTARRVLSPRAFRINLDGDHQSGRSCCCG